MATQLVRYDLLEGGSLLVEVAGDAHGYEHCAREAGGVLKAGRTIEAVFDQVIPSARAILHSLAALDAAEVHVEFGVKLSGEVGLVVAKSSMEGHFGVRMAFLRTAPAVT